MRFFALSTGVAAASVTALTLTSLGTLAPTAYAGNESAEASLVIAAETPLDAAGAAPGRPVTSSVRLLGATGAPMAGQMVRLTTDRGFFTPHATTTSGLTPDPAAVAGADAGEWKSFGDVIDVVTDAQGVAVFALAIERDTGFDDDGAVSSTVTASAGSLSDAEGVTWTSANPDNGGLVDLALAPAARQESGVLPQAPTTDRVLLDVVTTDQFGNRVGGENVTVTDNVAGSSVVDATAVSDFAADGDVAVTSQQAQDQVVTASWTTSTRRYAGAPPAVVAGSETLSDSATVEWYAVDRDASTYTLTHSGPATQDVGSIVVSTYAARDQLGEPVSDIFVQLFRSGPDGAQDGEPVVTRLLGQTGELVYTFQGAQEGTATLSALGRLGSAGGSAVPGSNVTDSVRFVATTPAPVTIRPRLTMRSLPGGLDRATVVAPRAPGARVQLFKAVGDGYERIGRSRMDAQGRASFVVRDPNVTRTTRYVAVVFATRTTLIAASNQVKIA